jgi:hypothetical protein
MIKQSLIIILIGIGALSLGPIVVKQQAFANNLPSLGGIAGQSITQGQSQSADTGNMFGSGNTNTQQNTNTAPSTATAGGDEYGPSWHHHLLVCCLSKTRGASCH